ncbi:MAG: cation:proton antiporter, partial [Bacteroidales bacterium]|nr:cation:proton antiporter [Bacteroidales bacterium]
MTIQSITLPLQNPVLIFALVLLIILLSPIVLRKLRIPGIIGLILAGVIIGPNGLNILLRDSSIVLFSTVGLLYIMLLSGLEIDMVQFRRSRHRSIFFGMATFLLPQVLGTMIGYYYLHFNLSTSTLLASMFASHTLITYPIANKLGLVQTEAVTIAIGGTIITNTLSLLILSIIVQLKHNALDISFIMQIILLAGFFGILIFWGVPRLTRWFFNNFAGEGYAHFLFVLVIAFLSASIAQLAKLEPIIGVFLAGIALNRLIPTNSSLMNRIEFVGNTLFIPFFLIGVGMLVDLKVLFQDSEAIKVAVAMTVVATATKWLAAFLTQLVYGYSSTQRRIIFGLTNGQAAATLAAVTIGYNLRLLNENVLNGSLLMILVTCLIASFATESAARKLALELDSNPEQLTEKPERILVPVSNPETVEKLIELAILVKDPMSAEPIYPLTVIQDTNSTDQQIAYCRKLMQHTIKQAAAADTVLQLVTRIDLNIASG